MKTEEKAKAYDSIIERANKMRHENCEACQMCIEELIPELKESEDERIRKVFIDYFKKYKKQEKYGIKTFCGIPIDNIITWFEKQDKPNTVSKMQVSEELYEHIRNTCACIDDALSSETLTDINDYLSMAEHSANSAFDMIEKQGEQIDSDVKDYNSIDPHFAKPIDKVEPKFKVGDWVIRSTEGFIHNTYLVTDVKDYYVCEDSKGRRVNGVYGNFKMWNISDAKPGDVLANDKIVLIVDHLGTFENSPIIYSWYFADSNKFYGEGTSEPDRWEVKGFTPATKEQCDFLFQKIKEAGYEWDAEKKELRKIEQKSANSYCQENCKGFQETGKCFADWDCKAKRRFSV